MKAMTDVVPAKAGTHNPGHLLLQKVSHIGAQPRGRGVWVPAFAGTTPRECPKLTSPCW
jgi:hypothetical protein